MRISKANNLRLSRFNRFLPLVNYEVEQRHGYGRALMQAIEDRLLPLGCPKLNLQIRTDNTAAIRFYERLGYQADAAVSMGKRLIEDKSEQS